ncbi:MAG: hypothetical protein SF051_16940, partial [Elusimicrobiota bacterium]|nr:hypothetical protein [Elusimicrobiota bacterium]
AVPAHRSPGGAPAVPVAGAPAAAPAVAGPAGGGAGSPLAVLTAVAAPRERPAPSPESSAAAAGSRFDLALPREESDAVLAAPADGPAPALPPSRPEPKPAKVKLPRTVWGTVIGHGVLTVFGIELHVISQPFLVMETLGQSKTTMGIVRNVHSGAYSLTNLLPIGYLVDKTDFRALFIGTSLARALMMGAIPALWLTGNLTIAALLVIVALNPLFQTTMVVAERSAIMAAVGKDEKLNKEATAVLGKWEALAGMFMPLLAGWALGALVTHFGLGGYALAYGIYSAMLVAAVPLYWFMVRDPRDPKDLGLEGFRRFGAETVKFLFAIVKTVLLLPFTALRGLWRFIRARRAAAPAADAAPARDWKEALARWCDGHESTKGLGYILRNRTLAILMMIGAIEAFLMEALPMVVLPNYIVDVVGTAPTGVPFIGTLLATSGGILGLMFSAEYFGRFLSSWYMEGERGDRLIAKWGHGRFYRAAATSSLLIWLMWVVPTFVAAGSFWVSLLAVVGVMGVLQFFHAPIHIVMAPVKRAEIPDEMLGRVESSFDMIDLALAATGALIAGLMLDAMSITWAMGVIAAAVTLTAAFQWYAPRLLFPDGKRPAPKP